MKMRAISVRGWCWCGASGARPVLPGSGSLRRPCPTLPLPGVKLLLRLSKGKQVNIPALGEPSLGVLLYGDVNELQDISASSGKSYLFFLTIDTQMRVHAVMAEDPGIGLSGDGVQRLAKHATFQHVRCACDDP